jgi:hypothetical protein
LQFGTTKGKQKQNKRKHKQRKQNKQAHTHTRSSKATNQPIRTRVQSEEERGTTLPHACWPKFIIAAAAAATDGTSYTAQHTE